MSATISQVFDEFLADQEARVTQKTYAKYRDIIELFESYLESYWPGHDQEEYARITEAGGTFCGAFGPEEIPGGYPEFLGYFMPHKVMAGKETLKAAGTVLNKLAKWLAEKGYVADTRQLQERAREASRNLSAGVDVLDLLSAYVEKNRVHEYGEEVEGHFWISRIEPGKIWLECLDPSGMSDPQIGPIPVPKKVTQMCQQNWDIGGVAAKARQGWRLVEIWNVTP